MTAERLIRVTSESELRPGMLVVVLRPPDANQCSCQKHRHMLLRHEPSPSWCNACIGDCRRWFVSPRPHDASEALPICFVGDIRDGRVYRVDLGDLTERTDECARSARRTETA